jgi:hypothetical protein
MVLGIIVLAIFVTINQSMSNVGFFVKAVFKKVYLSNKD